MRDILRRNIGYKTISLILAIIFWLWITSQTDTAGLFGRQTLSIPLVTYNQPPNLVIVSDIPTVTVSLDNSNQSVSVKDLFAYVDLKDAVAGEHSFQVRMDEPQGVKIESISPISVVLRLEAVRDKIVPVITSISGTPSSGFVAGDPVITPPVVNVRGPASILEKLESVYIEVNVSGVKDSMRVARPIMFKDIESKGIFASNPNLESMHAFPDTVEVIVPIYAKGTASKMVPLRVSTGGSPAEGMMVRSVAPVPAQVKIIGDEELLNTIQFISLGTINVNGFSQTRVIDTPLSSVNLPSGISFSEGTQISVMVTIGPAPISRTLKDIPIDIRNVSPGLTAQAIPPVEVTISGYPEIINNLQAQDIVLWVDATGLTEGSYPDTSLLWKAPTGVGMVSVPRVKLELKAQPTGPVDTTGDNGVINQPVQ